MGMVLKQKNIGQKYADDWIFNAGDILLQKKNKEPKIVSKDLGRSSEKIWKKMY